MRTIIAVVMWACVAAHAWAQAPAKSAEAKPLRVEVTAEKTRVCLDEGSIYLTVRVTNVSRERVVIDPDGVWSRVTFFAPAPSDRSYTNESKAWFEGKKPRTRDLNPGRSFRDSAYQILSNQFFTIPGTYRLKVIYGPYALGSERPGVYLGPVESNELSLQVVDCKK